MNNNNLYILPNCVGFFANNNVFFAAAHHPKPHLYLADTNKWIFAINMYYRVVALKMSCLSLLSY
jgi:hypothetical protein